MKKLLIILLVLMGCVTLRINKGEVLSKTHTPTYMQTIPYFINGIMFSTVIAHEEKWYITIGADKNGVWTEEIVPVTVEEYEAMSVGDGVTFPEGRKK